MCVRLWLRQFTASHQSLLAHGELDARSSTLLNDLVTQFCIPGSLLIGISGSAHSVLRHQGGRNTSSAAAQLGYSCEAPPTSPRTHGGRRGFTPTGLRPGSVGCWWSLAWLAALMLVPADSGEVNGGVLLLLVFSTRHVALMPVPAVDCDINGWRPSPAKRGFTPADRPSTMQRGLLVFSPRHAALMLVPADGGDGKGGVLSSCKARTHRPTGLRPGGVGCWFSHHGTWL